MFLLRLSFLLILLMCGNTANAALGEKAASVEMDRSALSAVRGSTSANDKYTVYEISSAANTVREFVSPSGIVFGMAWDGLVSPDMEVLLGTYYKEYELAFKNTPRQRGSRHLHVRSSSVVVEKWGHMRSYHGRIYSPVLIPPDVSPDEIK